MAWTVPKTWTVGEVVTAAMMNAQVRDNLEDLDARSKGVEQSVGTQESTTSTTFTDLSTAGPAITLVTGTLCWVSLYGTLRNDTAGRNAFLSIQVSGASTVDPINSRALLHTSHAADAPASIGCVLLLPVNAGSNTFTMKYRAGASGGTASFGDRRLAAWPANKLS